MEDTVEIILADTPEMVNSIFWDNPSLNLSDIRRIQRNFKIFWKERLESFRLEVLPGLSEHCIQLFRRQFMQIRCTLCGSFICDHTG
jgi:ribosomal protein S27E